MPSPPQFFILILYDDLLFDLPSPLISSWPPLCILLLVPIPSSLNYFIFLGPSFLLPSPSLLFLLPASSPIFYCRHLCPCFISSLLRPLISAGPEHILDATSTVCYATYGMFMNPDFFFVWNVIFFSRWSHLLRFPTLFATFLPACHLCVLACLCVLLLARFLGC